MKHPISFGTSGHRGIMGESFTYEHVAAIAKATANILQRDGQSVRLCIGYDPREGNTANIQEKSFTQTVVNTLLAAGVDVEFCSGVVPTPIISWYIRHFDVQGGFILTASHNPPEYNGIKFNPHFGQPASPDWTRSIETEANQLNPSKDFERAAQPGVLEMIDPTPAFAQGLIKTLATFFGEKTYQGTILADCRNGATARAWPIIAEAFSEAEWVIINDTPMSDFGGIEPNPTQPDSLQETGEQVRIFQADLGVANDPDGDRHIILDEKGHPLTPEETTVIIGQYCIDTKRPLAGIVTTLASSQIVAEFCEKNQVKFQDTEVGFKHFFTYLKEANDQNELLLAVESSGGFSFSSHIYEKCGLIPVLMIGMIAQETQTKVSKLRQNIIDRYGQYHFLETAVQLNETNKPVVAQWMQTADQSVLQTIFTQQIARIDQRDGLKMVCSDGSWVLFRLSGTEPVVRIYAESKNEQFAKELLEQAQHKINQF